MLATWGPIVSGLLVGALPWLKLWAAARESGGQRRADLIKIAQEAAASVIDELRAEADRLRERLEKVEGDFGEFRRTHDTMIADKDAEIAMLRGQLRQALAHADTYERLLTKHEIPHDKPTQPFWRVAAGDYPTELEPR